jgi:type III secretion protein V
LNTNAQLLGNTLEKESQLYGAMDGAMKFVKGDAIAGIIIIIVNILGGISIGSLQQGMEVADALQLYAMLTVGDGLVAQIPALLIAMTAGIIVTRVTVDENSNVGNDIANQITNQPKALLIASVFMVGFAMIPGFPSTVFIFLALLIGGIGLTLHSASKPRDDIPSFGQSADYANGTSTSVGSDSRGAKVDLASSNMTLSVPLVIEVAESVKTILSAVELNHELGEVRRALYRDLGVPFPGIDLVFRHDLPQGNYQILLDEVPVASGHLRSGMLLARESLDTLELMGFSVEKAERFLPDLDSLWLKEEEESALIEANMKFMKTSQILIYHLAFVLKRHSGEFIGIQECRHLIEQTEKTFPDLVKEVQRIVPVQKMTEIFSRLVSEDISIRNMRLVLQSLVEWGQTEKDPILLAEYVRSSLKRHISYKYSAGQNIISAYILDPAVEDLIRKGIRQTSSGSYLALEPDATASLMQSMRTAIGDISKHVGSPVVLTSIDIRRYVRRLIEAEFYDVPVLSYQEITEEVAVQPLSRVSL